MTSTLAIAQQEELLRRARTANLARERRALPPITAAEPGERRALSFAQQRLWFLEQLGGLGSAYHMRKQMRLHGALDRDALRRALDRIVARHEALRTTFAVVHGEPEQRIAPVEESGFALLEHDLAGHSERDTELHRLVVEESDAPFDLERGPLVRGRLIRLAEDDHVLLVTMHHIVTDGWSMGIFSRELSALYGAFVRGQADPLPPLPVQYADYAAWQRRWIGGEVLRQQAEYWQKALAGAPELLELPADRPRPPRQDHAGAALVVELDAELTAGLKALARRHGATLFATLLAGWAVVLGRLSGQRDVVIGTPTANRGRKESEGLIGFFLNTLALRVELTGSPTVAELLGRVKERTLEAQQHQDIPFEQVVERVRPTRNLGDSPLFQVMFAWQNAPREGVELPGLAQAAVGTRAEHGTAKLDLALSLRETGGRIMGAVEYRTSLFEAATMERWFGYLRRVLEEMAEGDGRAVDRLAMLPEAERAQLLEGWNATQVEYPAESCAHELFEQQVERTPDAVAVVCEDQALTYAELNRRANRLAHALRARGVGPDVRVAIAAERNAEMVVAVLGVLKAGGAYVPLDPAYPPERLRYMVRDSAPAVLLAHPALAERFAGLGAPVAELSGGARAWAEEPDANPVRAGLTPEHLAYLIYTSGTTGTPKGVMVRHRGLCNLLPVQRLSFAAGPRGRVLQFSSFSFDGCVFEIVQALFHGGSLHLPPGGEPPLGEVLSRMVAEQGITHAILPPSVLASLPEGEGLDSIHTLVAAGDALPRAVMSRWRHGRRLLNGYGPTENTITGTIHLCDADEPGSPPIGRPLPNARVYLLDAAGEPAPVGVVGVLCLGGVQVARGYQNQPALTAERFVPDPFSGRPGARLYRTGDLGRRRADGTLEFVGRDDFQVKVRGFRVEPAEIEARLAEHPGVREAVVAARKDAAGDERLVGYYVGADGPVEVEALRAYLAERLPEHMVPAALVALEALPLTPLGKVDRRALPAPEDGAYARRGYEAPVGDTEAALAEIWAEVLKVERVGRWDHFFELGGHSLLVVTLIERMRQRGLHAELRAIFTTPTLAELAAAVAGPGREVEVPANVIPPGCREIRPGMLPLVELTQAEIDAVVAAVPGGAANVQDIYPLAPLQEGILFHHLLGTEGDPYLLASLSSFATREALDGYLGALQAVVDRHDVLRTAVVWEGVREPVQVVWRRAVLQVEEVALDPDAGDAGQQLYRRFDPRRGRMDVRRAPMLQPCIARDAAGGQWLLLLRWHHLIGDHTTLDVLQSEVRAHLRGEADRLPEPMPFRNLVAQARRGGNEAEHEAFFRRLLGDVAEPTAPFGLLDVHSDGTGIAEGRRKVDDRLGARLRDRARVLGVSAASLFHVAWAQVLARVTGRDDVVFGTVLFGRMLGGAGADRVMGPFINTLPVRLRTGEGAEACVRGMHALLAELLRHEHASLALAQRCSRVHAPTPLFSSLLNYRHGTRRTGPAAPRDQAGMRRIRAEDRSNYPLSLSVDDVGDGFGLTAKVQARAGVDPARLCAMMHRALEGLAGALEEEPRLAVARIDVVPEEERRRMLEEWNGAAAELPRDACIHDLFERQVERTPDAVAVVHGDRAVSYAELNRRANRLAHHLRGLGVSPETLVGISVERSLEMVVAFFAVFKAGGAYVPLDPSYPPERLAYMVEDSAPAVLLTQAALAERFAAAAPPKLRLDADAHRWAGEPATNPPRGALGPLGLAYTIYTSGSTGRPKGVMVQHRGTVNRVTWMQAVHGLGAHDSQLQNSSFSFDASVWELLLPLSVGARVVLAPHEGHKDPARLVEAIRSERVTRVNFIASMLQIFLETAEVEGCASVARVTVGGEALSPALARRLHERLPGTELYNQYGPAESAASVTGCVAVAGGASRVPIGRPMANVRLYVLGADGEPAPAGVVGEVYLGGAQVARGYLRRPALTAERFLPDPFGSEPGGRLYRTGDLGRWLPDGTVELAGRNDDQVKVRGFRIELGEIEARLAEHPGVREAAVTAREDVPGDVRLVAYYAADAALEAQALRSHLGQRLPEYMVPSAYVRLDALPLTPSGKLDRRALPAPEGDAYARRGYAEPVGETETAVAEIWAELLGVERVGRWDHFFELGGHSLLAVRLLERLRQRGLRADVQALFTTPTLADFAAVAEGEASEVVVPPNLIPELAPDDADADVVELRL